MQRSRQKKAMAQDGAGWRAAEWRFDFRQRQDNFCRLRKVWTGSRVHPLSYSMCTEEVEEVSLYRMF
jgi:hypothetical protein